MKAIEFAVWLRDDVGVIRHSREGDCLAKPSNGELKRWIKNGAVQVNGKLLTTDDVVCWPITNLVLFPKGRRVSLV